MNAPIPPVKSYCDVADDPDHRPYHDLEYGFPLRGDNALFERLCLEINQAGLSWLTILRKRENFRAAYDGFDVGKVAAYGEVDRARLLSDAGIVRNKLKVKAAIENARSILKLREEHGSFAAWLDSQHPLTHAEWQKLFRKTFFFTGGLIVKEFLMSTGYLPGAHREDCPVYERVLAQNPPWAGAVG